MISHAFSALVQAPSLCARVIAHDRGSYIVATELGDLRAHLLGALRHELHDPHELPIVGDYVSLKISEGTHLIERVLPRTNLFARRAIDGSHTLQPIAANLDTLFVTVSVNRDFNARRIERYIVAAHAYSVPTAIVLTKTDLAGNAHHLKREAETIAGDIPVLAVSGLTGAGVDQLDRFRGSTRTIAFVGSSGAGKSTLINCLLQDQVLPTGGIREKDERGRHTTTRRLLLYLADGTAVIDSPGMREFALADARDGIDTTFDDIAALAARCRFSDCRHQSEPGCAVRGAVNESRLTSFRKLEKEAAFEARKTDRRAQTLEKERWKAIHKANRRRRKD